MKFPQLYTQQAERQMIDLFKGYNHNLRINEGEFYDMENLSSDYYPVLSPRRPRGTYELDAGLTGLIAKDSLCYTAGQYFVMNEYRIDMGLSNEPKQLISMGAYVIIMPDKKYINTMDLTDYGDIEQSYTSSDTVSFELCALDGSAYSVTTISGDEPENPQNLEYWIDTSTTPHTLKQYSETNAVWVSIATTYVKISAKNIGKNFEQYDGVTISGVKDAALADLNNTMVIWEKADDYIVVVGLIDQVTTQTDTITVKRLMPNLDYITESGNRLWGCRYGVAVNGDVVNEIYACKLGDFRNWNCFMGLSTDSYVASCGTDGPFTGAATLTYPIFFKENCLHKVYGSQPSNFQIQATECRGVQKGCSASLAVVNETLFYKSRNDVMAYDGSLPLEASYALGGEAYSDAVAGACGNKYYISMKDSAGQWNLFVFDTARSLWHKEDHLHALALCACRGEMYAIDIDASRIATLNGSGTAYEDSVEWMAQTGEIGLESPDMKYISRLTIRMFLGVSATLKIYIQYDLESDWHFVCSLEHTNLRSFSIPIRPRRCDHLKLKFVGEGDAKIYSITKTIEQGSELS